MSSIRENILRLKDEIPQNVVLVAISKTHLPDMIMEAYGCLLYTSDAADDLHCVDLGGRRIIKKKHMVLAAECSTDNDSHAATYQ